MLRQQVMMLRRMSEAEEGKRIGTREGSMDDDLQGTGRNRGTLERQKNQNQQ